MVPHGGDPLHHAAAVDLPGRARVLGEHPARPSRWPCRRSIAWVPAPPGHRTRRESKSSHFLPCGPCQVQPRGGALGHRARSRRGGAAPRRHRGRAGDCRSGAGASSAPRGGPPPSAGARRSGSTAAPRRAWPARGRRAAGARAGTRAGSPGSAGRRAGGSGRRRSSRRRGPLTAPRSSTAGRAGSAGRPPRPAPPPGPGHARRPAARACAVSIDSGCTATAKSAAAREARIASAARAMSARLSPSATSKRRRGRPPEPPSAKSCFARSGLPSRITGAVAPAPDAVGRNAWSGTAAAPTASEIDRRIERGGDRLADLPPAERLLLRLEGEVADAPARHGHRAGLAGRRAGREEEVEGLRVERRLGLRGVRSRREHETPDARTACPVPGPGFQHDAPRRDLDDRERVRCPGSGAFALSRRRRQHDREGGMGEDGEQRRVRLHERDLHGPRVGRADLLDDARRARGAARAAAAFTAGAFGCPGRISRSRLSATCCAVSGVPSWNRTPSRRRNVQTSPSLDTDHARQRRLDVAAAVARSARACRRPGGRRAARALRARTPDRGRRARTGGRRARLPGSAGAARGNAEDEHQEQEPEHGTRHA